MKKFEELTDFEKELRKKYEGYKTLSKNTGIKLKELIQIIQIRELMLSNGQMRDIHEHLDEHFPIKAQKKPDQPKQDEDSS